MPSETAQGRSVTFWRSSSPYRYCPKRRPSSTDTTTPRRPSRCPYLCAGAENTLHPQGPVLERVPSSGGYTSRSYTDSISGTVSTTWGSCVPFRYAWDSRAAYPSTRPDTPGPAAQGERGSPWRSSARDSGTPPRKPHAYTSKKWNPNRSTTRTKSLPIFEKKAGKWLEFAALPG